MLQEESSTDKESEVEDEDDRLFVPKRKSRSDRLDKTLPDTPITDLQRPNATFKSSVRVKPCFVKLVDFLKSEQKRSGDKKDFKDGVARNVRKSTALASQWSKAQLRFSLKNDKKNFPPWQLNDSPPEVPLTRNGSANGDNSTLPPVVATKQRRPLRVLSLFDGISAAVVALKKLGLEVIFG